MNPEYTLNSSCLFTPSCVLQAVWAATNTEFTEVIGLEFSSTEDHSCKWKVSIGVAGDSSIMCFHKPGTLNPLPQVQLCNNCILVYRINCIPMIPGKPSQLFPNSQF